MFLRISIDSDFESNISLITEILDAYNFNHTLKYESYRESKLKFPGETWVIGNGSKAEITLVVDIKNRNQTDMIGWIITCLDKKIN